MSIHVGYNNGPLDLAAVTEAKLNPRRGFIFADDDFVADIDHIGGTTEQRWNHTDIGSASSTFVISDAHGGVAVLDCVVTGANDDKGGVVQMNAETVKPQANKVVTMVWRVKANDVDKLQMFCGLHVIGTPSAYNSSGTIATSLSKIGFYADATSQSATAGGLYGLSRDGSNGATTTTTAIGTLADDTFAEFGFRVIYNTTGQSNTIQWFWNGELVQTTTSAYCPTEELAPTFWAISEGSPSVSSKLSIDYTFGVSDR